MFHLADILLIVVAVVAVIAAGLYFLNRWASKKVGTQQDMIEKAKQTASIYVIDKKKTKASEGNLPKAVMDNLPKMYKVMKMYLVKAKIGSQIMTLICDKKVFQALPVKKNVKVDVAGIYIIGLKGMKTEKDKKDLERAKKREEARGYDGASEKPWYKKIFGGGKS